MRCRRGWWSAGACSPTHLHIDAHGDVELELRNVGRLPTASLRADDQASPLLTSTSRFTTRPLVPGESVRLRYPLVGASARSVRRRAHPGRAA